MNSEIWKTIDGYDDKYQISSYGRVRSIPRKVQFGNTQRITKEKIIKPCSNGNGYYYVSLGRGINNRKYIHRLVCEAFLPNPDNKPCIDHINTDRTDNRVENLRWVTHKENINNPLTIDKKSKPIVQLSKCGNHIKTWDSIKNAETELNLTHIWACCSGKRKTCGGYMWKYTSDQLTNN